MIKSLNQLTVRTRGRQLLKYYPMEPKQILRLKGPLLCRNKGVNLTCYSTGGKMTCKSPAAGMSTAPRPHITLSTSSSLPQSVPLCSFAPSLTHRLSFDSLPRSLLSYPILNLPLSQVRAGRRAACVRPTPTATTRRASPPSAESPRCARTRAHTRGGTMVSEDAQPCACVRVRALERACLPHRSAPEPAESPRGIAPGERHAPSLKPVG